MTQHRILADAHRLLLTPSLDTLSFPQTIDNTIRSTFAHCQQKFVYSHLHKLSPQGTNVHLHAGGAFAHGMEATRRAYFEQNLSPDDAVAVGVGALIKFYGDYEAPEGSAKSLERMAGALEYYFSIHRLDNDFLTPYTSSSGERGIEFSFSIPLPIPHPETGEPLLYCGRFDMLATHKNGSLFVVDEKTSTSLGAQWSRNWNLDSQFTGYLWGAQQYGLPVSGAIIRGISILKTKYDTAEAIIYRPQWQIERWYTQLLREVEYMLRIYADTKLAFANLDKHGCNAYGGCAYERLCSSPNPEAWASQYYETNTWDPLRREHGEG